MPPIILKLEYHSEFRRTPMLQPEVTYQVIQDEIHHLFPELSSYTAKYLDDEGDACTFVEASFYDFMFLSQSRYQGEFDTEGHPVKSPIWKLELFDHPSRVAAGAQTASPTFALAGGDHWSMLERHFKEHWMQHTKQHAQQEPVVHSFITCDGCNASPLKGTRFKCKACPDYDLCQQCFAKKDTVHGGECAGHEFEEIVEDQHQGRKHCYFADGQDAGLVAKFAIHRLIGKGKGKGKGCGWGKGQCKGPKGANQACATPGCSFQASWHSWHPAHCCGRCARSSGHDHGHWCEQTEFKADAVVTESSAVAGSAVPEENSPAKEQPKTSSTRLAFPVVVEDGRQLVLEWERGQEPEQVAKSFADQHKIPMEELQTIVAFVQHAEQVVIADDETSDMAIPEVQKEEELTPPKFQDEISMLQNMGFAEVGADGLCSLLECFDGDVQKVVETLTQQ